MNRLDTMKFCLILLGFRKCELQLTNTQRLVVVMGRDFRLSTAKPVVLSPDRSEFDRVSERDQLGLTPNLTTRDLLRSKRWATGNDNFVYSSLWDFKSSITRCKILRHATFPLYFPSERKVCCGFLSPLKIHRLRRVRTRNLWVQWQAH
jgi:hypothetical protein